MARWNRHLTEQDILRIEHLRAQRHVLIMKGGSARKQLREVGEELYELTGNHGFRCTG